MKHIDKEQLILKEYNNNVAISIYKNDGKIYKRTLNVNSHEIFNNTLKIIDEYIALSCSIMYPEFEVIKDCELINDLYLETSMSYYDSHSPDLLKIRNYIVNYKMSDMLLGRILLIYTEELNELKEYMNSEEFFKKDDEIIFTYNKVRTKNIVYLIRHKKNKSIYIVGAHKIAKTAWETIKYKYINN